MGRFNQIIVRNFHSEAQIYIVLRTRNLIHRGARVLTFLLCFKNLIKPPFSCLKFLETIRTSCNINRVQTFGTITLTLMLKIQQLFFHCKPLRKSHQQHCLQLGNPKASRTCLGDSMVFPVATISLHATSQDLFDALRPLLLPKTIDLVAISFAFLRMYTSEPKAFKNSAIDKSGYAADTRKSHIQNNT